MEKKLSYYSLLPHLKSLRWCGYYQLDSNAPTAHKYFHKFYRTFVFCFISLYTVQQSMKVFQVRSNAAHVMNTLFLLLTNSNALFKQYTLWVRSPQIEELLEMMKGPLFNQGLPSHNELLRATCRQALRLLRWFENVALVTCLLWVIYPMVLHVRGRQGEFSVWFPFEESVDPQFYLALVYVWIQTSWLAYGNTTQDSFISFIFVQSKTQIAILRLDLETFVEKSKEFASIMDIEVTNALNIRFRALLDHYAEIDKYNRKVQDIFGTVLIIQFTLSGWILCCTTYRMASISPSSVEFISMGMYLLCMLWESFLFCYYGNDLNLESEGLIGSAYNMDWLQLPVSQRKNLILFMERVKRPMLLLGGAIIPLTNRTFISVIRSGYSFYAFLKNSN